YPQATRTGTQLAKTTRLCKLRPRFFPSSTEFSEKLLHREGKVSGGLDARRGAAAVRWTSSPPVAEHFPCCVPAAHLTRVAAKLPARKLFLASPRQRHILPPPLSPFLPL